MPFRRTFSSHFTKYVVPSAQFTYDPSYLDPFLVKIQIYDKDRVTLLHSYDMFNTNANTSALQTLDITNSYISKNFELSFANDDDDFDPNEIGLGCYVKITGGKKSTDNHFIIGGYVMDTEEVEIANGLKDYKLMCDGEKAQLNRIITTFRRASTSLQDIGDDVIKLPTSKMTIYNLLLEYLTKKDVRITKDFTLQNYYRLDLSGISEDLDETLFSISEQLQEASEPINFLSSLTNAFWDIQDGKIIVKHPELTHSGIILKNIQVNTDLANSTAYFYDRWSFMDTIRKSYGHANGLINLSSADTKSVASQNISDVPAVLYKRKIAQQFTAIDTRFQSFALIMSKHKEVFPSDTPSEDQVIKGEVRLDNNNKPDGPLIATFEVPISSLKETKDTIFINDINISSDVLSPNAKYWLILGPVGQGLGKTASWYHDGMITHNDPTHYSAFAVAEDTTSSVTWQISNIGPTYAFNVFSKIRRLQYYKDPDSEGHFGLTEDVVDFPEVEDPLSITRLMQSLIKLRSRPIRIYTMNKVSIPNGKIFVPGQAITINDSTLRHQLSKNVFAIIQEVRYRFNAYDESAMGLISCEVLPVGFVDFKIEELYGIG